ncbi:ciliary neurotrophic factor receptor subunit alpha-like protein, partial [Lates japonicus]
FPSRPTVTCRSNTYPKRLLQLAPAVLNTHPLPLKWTCKSTIVKPDPPERVTATPIRFNPRRLEVSWHSPATWPDIDNFPLKYFLRYRPLIRDQWQHVELSDSTSHTAAMPMLGRNTSSRWLPGHRVEHGVTGCCFPCHPGLRILCRSPPGRRFFCSCF